MFHKLLPVDKMLELEDWVDRNQTKEVNSTLSERELAKNLQLKVEYIPPDQVDPDIEAELCPSGDPAYYGIICINERFGSKLFSFMHEIMHYLYDVGAGQHVSQVFTRKVKGKTENEHEQHINYLAASYSMRYTDIEKAIQEYDASRPKMDELKFVDSLCHKYHQGRVTVIRRIREVRKISKKRRGSTAI